MFNSPKSVRRPGYSASPPRDSQMEEEPVPDLPAMAAQEAQEFVVQLRREADEEANCAWSIIKDPEVSPASFDQLNQHMIRMDALVERLWELRDPYPVPKWDKLVMAAELYGDSARRRGRKRYLAPAQRRGQGVSFRGPGAGEEKPFFDLDGGEDDDDKDSE